jgi:hypothetical protein
MAGLRRGVGRQLVVAFDSGTGEVVAIGTVQAINAPEAEEAFFSALEMHGGVRSTRMQILAEKNRWFAAKVAKVRLTDLGSHVVLLNV